MGEALISTMNKLQPAMNGDDALWARVYSRFARVLVPAMAKITGSGAESLLDAKSLKETLESAKVQLQEQQERLKLQQEEEERERTLLLLFKEQQLQQQEQQQAQAAVLQSQQLHSQHMMMTGVTVEKCARTPSNRIAQLATAAVDDDDTPTCED